MWNDEKKEGFIQSGEGKYGVITLVPRILLHTLLKDWDGNFIFRALSRDIEEWLVCGWFHGGWMLHLRIFFNFRMSELWFGIF